RLRAERAAASQARPGHDASRRAVRAAPAGPRAAARAHRRGLMPPHTLAQLADAGQIDHGWADALAPLQPLITELGERLRAEQTAGHGYLPAGENVLRAFQRPLEDVRVLITGQDPYPTPGHPIGLSF